MEERMYWVAWSRIPKFGGRRLLSLYEAFGSLEAAWHAPLTRLADVPDLGPTLAIEAVAWRKGRDPAAELAAVSGSSHRVYTWVDAGYPEPLRTIPDPPPVLYVMGEFPDWSKAIGVVGMRKPSGYGERVASRLGRELASLGAVIVSGVAYGIDRLAHEAALSVGDGLTVGVLGGGFQYVYPAAHRPLCRAIADRGCLMTEYPPAVEANKQNFPYRNRIISGLSRGVVVVEAKRKSGTLHTVDHALEQGRPVFAVPGPIGSEGSEGPHELIRQGARLVSGVGDILEELGWVTPAPPSAPKTSDDPVEQAILTLLSQGPKPVDSVAIGTGLDAARLGGVLTVMELKGLVSSLPGQRYQLA